MRLRPGVIIGTVVATSHGKAPLVQRDLILQVGTGLAVYAAGVADAVGHRNIVRIRRLKTSIGAGSRIAPRAASHSASASPRTPEGCVGPSQSGACPLLACRSCRFESPPRPKWHTAFGCAHPDSGSHGSLRCGRSILRSCDVHLGSGSNSHCQRQREVHRQPRTNHSGRGLSQSVVQCHDSSLELPTRVGSDNEIHTLCRSKTGNARA